MREAMAFMKQQGFDISILFSIPEDYYTRFGYTSVLPEYSAAVTGLRCLNRLSRLKTHLNTRALRKSDIPLLAPLYETSFREVTGSCIRSSEHWHWLSSHPEFSGVGVMSDNGLAAYALTKATRNDLVVHEVGPTLLLR